MVDVNLPRSAFVDPHGRNLPEVRDLAHRVVDQVLEHRAGAAARAPLPQTFALPFQAEIPAAPVPEEEILRKLRALLDASANTVTPSYLGHMCAFPTAISSLGDFVASSINNNLIGLELSPAFSLLESGLTYEIGRLFGLPKACGGLAATGGSLSNLHALAVARNVVLDTLRTGVRALTGRPVLLASEVAHASIQKSAMILGLGSDGVIPVATNGRSQLDPTDLAAKVAAARASGAQPFCVVATAGTTVTGNVDPITEIADIARAEGLWLHVDAAWGGGLQFTGKYRHRLAGIERADSITFCPQKLLLVAVGSSLTLFRDWERMERAFRITFPYLQDEEKFVNRSEVGVQGSRPAEVLKLWLSLQHLGASAYGALIESWIELADYVASKVAERTWLETAGEPESGIVCFRGVPPSLPVDEVDAWNVALHAFLLRDAGIYLSFVRYRGKGWLRAVFANPYVDRETIDRLFDQIDRFADGRVGRQ